MWGNDAVIFVFLTHHSSFTVEPKWMEEINFVGKWVGDDVARLR